MKQPSYIQIDIPEPCSQRWEEMTPVSHGRHCSQCQATVIDFTTWTDRELYNFFAVHKGNVCGRYLSSQIGRPIHIPYQPHSLLYRMTVALGFTLMLTTGVNAVARAQAPVASSPFNKKQHYAGTPRVDGGLKGTVTDYRKEPVVNAFIRLYKNNTVADSVVSDFNGEYVVKNIQPGYYRLEITYPGYHSVIQDVTITDTTVTVDIAMKPLPVSHPHITLGGKRPLIKKQK